MVRISKETGTAKDDLASEIEQNLLSALARANPQSANESFILKASALDGHLVGGLTASTSYGWLLVKTLWVSETCRGSGVGRKLMETAEQEGIRLGCHGAWLDTSNIDTHRFYKKLGYHVFGQLENGPEHEPTGHIRWFLKKALTESSS